MRHPRRICTAVFFLAAITCLPALTVPAAGAEPAGGETTQAPAPAGDCRALIEAIDAQKAAFQREMGQIKRELAAMRQEMTRPGLRDVLAGIGYIFGMAGVALYVHSRKERGRGAESRKARS